MATSRTKKRVGAGALTAGALAAAMALIVPWEGRETTKTSSGEYASYIDIVGVVTACDGITRGVALGETYTKAECDTLLAKEIQDSATAISRCVVVPLSDKEAGAYISAIHNLGPGLVCGSTLQRKLNSGDRVGACQELPRWNKAGGRVVQGLVNRRAAEMKDCLEGAAKWRS